MGPVRGLATVADVAYSELRSAPATPMSRVRPTKFMLSRFRSDAVFASGHTGLRTYARLPLLAIAGPELFSPNGSCESAPFSVSCHNSPPSPPSFEKMSQVPSWDQASPFGSPIIEASGCAGPCGNVVRRME